MMMMMPPLRRFLRHASRYAFLLSLIRRHYDADVSIAAVVIYFLIFADFLLPFDFLLSMLLFAILRYATPCRFS